MEKFCQNFVNFSTSRRTVEVKGKDADKKYNNSSNTRTSSTTVDFFIVLQTANSPLFVSSPNVSSRATDLKAAGLQSQTPQSNVNSPRFLDTERSVRFDSSSPWTGSGTTPQHSDKLRSRFAMVEQPKPSG